MKSSVKKPGKPVAKPKRIKWSDDALASALNRIADKYGVTAKGASTHEEWLKEAGLSLDQMTATVVLRAETLHRHKMDEIMLRVKRYNERFGAKDMMDYVELKPPPMPEVTVIKGLVPKQPTKAPAKAPTKPAKAPKAAPAPAKPKASGRRSIGNMGARDEWGNYERTQAGAINRLLRASGGKVVKFETLVKETGVPMGNVKGHVRCLAGKGFVELTDGGCKLRKKGKK